MKLNQKLSLVSESPTVKLNALAQSLIAQGKKVINLAVGELDFATPEYIRTGVGKQLARNKYTPTLGLPSLRQMIAKQVTKDYGMKFGVENVAVTAGSKLGLFEILSVILNRGDQVIVPVPYWVSHLEQIRLLGARPVPVPLTSRFDLDVAEIKKSITKKTKAIILNSPHNPTGGIFSRESLKKLRSLISGKPIYVIVDDVYAKINFSKQYTTPAKFAPNRKYLILASSFSKSQALTGWRIGYVAASREVINGINVIQSHMSGNASIISQLAAIEILKQGDKSDKFVAILRKRRDLVAKALRSIPNISFQIPAGAFYFFIDVSQIDKNSRRFCEKLLTRGLAVVPGEAFGSPGFVRLSFAASEKELKQGLKILEEFCKTFKN